MLFNSSDVTFLGDGNSILFWQVPWLQGKSIADFAPDLVAVVAARHRRSTTVALAISSQCCIQDITGALTVPVIAQYLLLREHLQGISLEDDIQDRFIER
jgi:hypothetical protein